MARRLAQTTDARFERYSSRARGTVERSLGALERTRDAYQRVYHAEFARWERLQRRIDRLEQHLRAEAAGDAAAGGASRPDPGSRALLAGLIREHEELTAILGRRRSELSRLELVLRAIESSRLLLDGHSNGGDLPEEIPADVRIRVVEAKEAERAHLAQEIHDGPAQSMANAIFQIEFIQRALEKDPSLVPGELRLLRRSLEQGLGEVRSYITQLRPPRLLQLGLYGAIGETVENVSALSGLEIESRFEAPVEAIDEAAQTVALRIAQEALQNARKHAGAAHVRVATRVDGAHWTLEVSDDGTGFDPTALAGREKKSFGLQFMRERARLIGAAVAVRSRPGSGTVVALTIPVREERG